MTLPKYKIGVPVADLPLSDILALSKKFSKEEIKQLLASAGAP